MSPKPRVTFASFDDHHDQSGNNNGAFWKAKLALIDDLSPDSFIAVGDFAEGGSGSAHVPDAFKPAYEEDCEELKLRWNEVRDAAGPKTKLTWIEGNHENAMVRALERGSPSFVKGFWTRFMRDTGATDCGVKWVGEKERYQEGSVLYIHGHQYPGRRFPKHHAHASAMLWGRPGVTVLVGHTHRPGYARIPSAHGGWEAYMVGAGRTMDPSFMKGEDGAWANEAAVVYTYPDGRNSVHIIRWLGDHFIFNGRSYK